mgnify:CR=1 FL=1
MTVEPRSDLLRELHIYLSGKGGFRFMFRRLRQRRAFLARIEAQLRNHVDFSHPAIAEARERWSTTSVIRIERNEPAVTSNYDGSYWVRAWIRVKLDVLPSSQTADKRRYRAAVADLPELTRQVFLAHRVDDLSNEEIARNMSIDLEDVRIHISKALLLISEHLNLSSE